MKKISLVYFAFAGLLLFSTCKKSPYDLDKNPERVYSLEKIMANMNGIWKMQSAVQIDELSLTKESIVVSDFYTADGAKIPNISFNTTDMTFVVDTVGLVLNDLNATIGKFKFDDERFPAKVILTDMADVEIATLNIASNLLSQVPMLQYSVTAKCSESDVFTTRLNFIKTNN